MSDDADFFLCVGDGVPSIEETLANGDGSAPDLSQPGTTISFVIQDEDHAADPFGGGADFVGSGASDPKVRYTWTADDVAKMQSPGRFNYRWVVTWPGNSLPGTFPDGEFPRRLLVSPRT